MSSRFRADPPPPRPLAPWCTLLLSIPLIIAVAACAQGGGPVGRAGEAGSSAGAAPAAAAPPNVVTSALVPGLNHSLERPDTRADSYYENPAAVAAGKRLFAQYNCSGCHSNGGGGMGPSLMDDEWIYGGRLDQIYDTLIHGRPNGMPAWGGKITEEQLWQLAVFVRSMSLPATLAAQHGPTPSQTPAPVPKAADQHDGWKLPPDTTNSYTSTLQGPG